MINYDTFKEIWNNVNSIFQTNLKKIFPEYNNSDLFNIFSNNQKASSNITFDTNLDSLLIIGYYDKFRFDISKLENEKEDIKNSILFYEGSQETFNWFNYDNLQETNNDFYNNIWDLKQLTPKVLFPISSNNNGNSLRSYEMATNIIGYLQEIKKLQIKTKKATAFIGMLHCDLVEKCLKEKLPEFGEKIKVKKIY